MNMDSKKVKNDRIHFTEKNIEIPTSPQKWNDFMLRQSLAMPVKIQFLESHVETEEWGFLSFERRSENIKG